MIEIVDIVLVNVVFGCRRAAGVGFFFFLSDAKKKKNREEKKKTCEEKKKNPHEGLSSQSNT